MTEVSRAGTVLVRLATAWTPPVVATSVFRIARLVGVNKDTVTRLALLAGAHAKAAHDELVAFSPLDA